MTVEAIARNQKRHLVLMISLPVDYNMNALLLGWNLFPEKNNSLSLWFNFSSVFMAVISEKRKQNYEFAAHKKHKHT